MDFDFQRKQINEMPESKGGKSTLENLQTLCEKCNLGKSNRVVINMVK